MSAQQYFDKAIAALRMVQQTQVEPINQAAALLVDAIVQNRTIYSFGASHSFIMTEELVYRTGGLMLINPIYPHGMNLFIRPIAFTSRMERLLGYGAELLNSVTITTNDVLLISSTSGRNAIVIDMAMEAKKRGITVIGITSLDYTNSVSSRHPSGKKLIDFCDVVIDNCAPAGDAVVEIEGFQQKVSPLSTVTGCAIVNALVAEIVARLVQQGVTPPVYISANLDNGDEHNARLLEENKHRIHYMG